MIDVRAEAELAEQERGEGHDEEPLEDVGRRPPSLEQGQPRGQHEHCRHALSESPGPRRRRERRSPAPPRDKARSEEHTSELQSQSNLVCRLLLEKKKKTIACRFLPAIIAMMGVCHVGFCAAEIARGLFHPQPATVNHHLRLEPPTETTPCNLSR